LVRLLGVRTEILYVTHNFIDSDTSIVGSADIFRKMLLKMSGDFPRDKAVIFDSLAKGLECMT